MATASKPAVQVTLDKNKTTDSKDPFSTPFRVIQHEKHMKICQPIPTLDVDYDGIRMCEYGSSSYVPIPTKVILVVGATGAGKSTLINAITNYLFGVKWEDDFRYKLIVEEGAGDQSKSQTQNITTYKFHPSRNSPLDYCLTIIDTPGFGDTRGKHMDKMITDQFRSLFAIKGCNCIDQIHGVVFVVQSSLVRLTEAQKYIFDSVLKLFGKDIEKSFLIAVTFSDSSKKPEVIEALRKDGVPYVNCFSFNNRALYYTQDLDSTNEDDEDEDELDGMSRYWKMGEKSFKRLFKTLESAHTVSAALTTSVLNERRDIELIMEGLPKHINKLLARIDEIEEEKKALEKVNTELDDSKDYTYTVIVTKIRKVEVPKERGVTTCDNCKVTCDKNCICSHYFKFWCQAMDWYGNCKICPNHCKSSDHISEGYIYEQYQEEETRTKEDIEKKYHEALFDKTKMTNQIEEMEMEVQQLNKEAIKNIRRALQCIEKLQSIALRPSTISVSEHIERLIEQERKEAKPGCERRIRYYKHISEDATKMKKLEKKDQTWFKKMISHVDEVLEKLVTT